ncbi:hypothetical protein CPC08DRAFT_774101, partial [Agrocybe pediades]
LDILAFPVLYGGTFKAADLEKILQLEEGDVEVILADLQSLVTIFREKRLFLELSLEIKRAGVLYWDLSAVQVQHITRSISIVSTTFKQGGIRAVNDSMSAWLWMPEIVMPIQRESRNSVRDVNGEKATYVSSDFFQAALQFPTFNLIKQMHTDPGRHQSRYTGLSDFLSDYLTCLHSVKDIHESAQLIYLQQIRQYCEAVLSLLEDSDLSSDWRVHFIYAYYHLLGPSLHRDSLNWHTFEIRQFVPREDGTFGNFIYHMSSRPKVMRGSWPFDNYLSDILEISNELTKGTKREAIFALSASFCLAFLCDNQSTTPDTRRIFKATGIDQSRRREQPWHWRRMTSRRRSLGNQPVIMEFAPWIGAWPEKLGNMHKAFRHAKTYANSVIENKIYTIPEFLHMNKRRRDRWLRQGFDIREHSMIHRKPDLWPDQILPVQYQRKQEWPLYMLLLDLLPRILSLSGRYEPLVTICRTKCLASLSRCWPNKSRRARQAIETYLQRMELEDNK